MVLGLGLELGALACTGGGTPATIQETVTVPARVQSTLSAASCSAGAAVNVTGELKLSGLEAEIILRNNQKGTHEHTEDAAASAVLVPADHTLSIPTQTATGEPVANPVLSVQLLDSAGNPVSEEIALGPCGAGPFAVTANADLTTTVTLTVAVEGCANHTGPTITLTGAVTFAGLEERLIVRDGTGGAVVGSTTTTIDVVALADGTTLSIPKQPVRGGVGGNPWISARLVDGEGKPLGDEVAVGRCVELSGEDEQAQEEHD
jgi:hypothetical protein